MKTLPPPPPIEKLQRTPFSVKPIVLFVRYALYQMGMEAKDKQ